MLTDLVLIDKLKKKNQRHTTTNWRQYDYWWG
jgi:hypothetical protein